MEELRFPRGTYAYSTAKDIVIRIDKPVQLNQIYIKKHRASEFWNSKSTNSCTLICIGVGTASFEAFLDGKHVIHENIIVLSDAWVQLIPDYPTPITKIAISAGVDIDSILFSRDTLTSHFEQLMKERTAKIQLLQYFHAIPEKMEEAQKQ